MGIEKKSPLNNENNKSFYIVDGKKYDDNGNEID